MQSPPSGELLLAYSGINKFSRFGNKPQKGQEEHKKAQKRVFLCLLSLSLRQSRRCGNTVHLTNRIVIAIGNLSQADHACFIKDSPAVRIFVHEKKFALR